MIDFKFYSIYICTYEQFTLLFASRNRLDGISPYLIWQMCTYS